MKSRYLIYLLLILITAATFLVGAVFYMAVEGLTFVDAYYLSVMTLTTVGYGDITPQTDLGKIFTTFYVLVGVGIIGIFIRTIIQGAGKRLTGPHEDEN